MTVTAPLRTSPAVACCGCARRSGFMSVMLTYFRTLVIHCQWPDHRNCPSHVVAPCQWAGIQDKCFSDDAKGRRPVHLSADRGFALSLPTKSGRKHEMAGVPF